MNRISWLAAGVSGLMLGLGLTTAQAADRVTFVSQGGAYQAAQTKAILDPLAAKLGIVVDQETSSDAYPVVKTQVTSGAVTWDVIDIASGDCLRGGAQGLIEPLDFSKLPNAAPIPAAYKSPYSVPYEFYSSVIGYNKTKFGDHPPQNWADFWDVKRFPGRRSLRNHPLATLEAALMADGVAPDKLYPLDVDRAYRKLAEIKPNITVWWTSGGQSAQLLHDGEVDMVMAWNGRVSAVAKEMPSITYTYNQGILQNTSLCILKGAPHRETALRFVNEAIDPVLQAHLPLEIDYGPGNPEAFKTGIISAQRASELPSAPDNAAKQALLSAAWWSSPDGEKAIERWLGFMAR